MTAEQVTGTERAGLAIAGAQAARVLAAIDEAETVAFLQELIRCPTVNPPGDVRRAAAVCAAKLREAGFETEVVGPTPEQQNVVATLRGRGNGPRLAFNAHYDVVPTGEESGWRYPPFGGEIHDGRVYGRGAGDDKASVTAQVMAGVALARSGVPLAGALIVTEVADEETAGHLGAGFIVEHGYVEADYVIVGEQTRGEICIGERGMVAVGLTVYGATGHAATPWMGANAIEAMAQVIIALRTELWPRLAARTHPTLAASTATISLIEGGVKKHRQIGEPQQAEVVGVLGAGGVQHHHRQRAARAGGLGLPHRLGEPGRQVCPVLDFDAQPVMGDVRCVPSSPATDRHPNAPESAGDLALGSLPGGGGHATTPACSRSVRRRRSQPAIASRNRLMPLPFPLL